MASSSEILIHHSDGMISAALEPPTAGDVGLIKNSALFTLLAQRVGGAQAAEELLVGIAK